MKKLVTLLLAGVTLLNVACKEKEEGENPLNRLIGPKLVHDETFVLEDNGLVSAHQYIVNFTQQGGAVDLKIVSSGIRGNRQYISSDQFCAEMLDQMIGNDSEVQIYDYVDRIAGFKGETVKESRYIQTLRITAQPNATKKQQEAQIPIWTDGMADFCCVAWADIFLRQAGAK